MSELRYRSGEEVRLGDVVRPATWPNSAEYVVQKTNDVGNLVAEDDEGQQCGGPTKYFKLVRRAEKEEDHDSINER